MNKTDVTIIGGGIIGLAIAKVLAEQGRSVVLLEANNKLGQGLTSRNSEVIHAGFYYPLNSLKSKLCTSGSKSLFEFCAQHKVPHQTIGKILVANSDEEHENLHVLTNRAEACGVSNIEWLDRKTLKKLEPALQGQAGILSPSTGIVNVHALVQALHKILNELKVDIALNTTVARIVPDTNSQKKETNFTLFCQQGDQPDKDAFQLKTRVLINAAGLQATAVAKNIAGLSHEHIPAMQWVKGSYFSYSGKNPFQHLVYPLPEKNQLGLGIHANINMEGQLHFGPDAEPINLDIANDIKAKVYDVSETKRDIFAKVIHRYFPALEKERLQPAYAGIRPRLQTKPNVTADFIIQSHDNHQITGLINLFGIESPGLTCCLSIAEEVKLLLR